MRIKYSIINYITSDDTKWTSTIKDYVLYHYPNGDKSRGCEDTIINYISGDNRAYSGRFAECIVGFKASRYTNEFGGMEFYSLEWISNSLTMELIC